MYYCLIIGNICFSYILYLKVEKKKKVISSGLVVGLYLMLLCPIFSKIEKKKLFIIVYADFFF